MCQHYIIGDDSVNMYLLYRTGSLPIPTWFALFTVRRGTWCYKQSVEITCMYQWVWRQPNIETDKLLTSSYHYVPGYVVWIISDHTNETDNLHRYDDVDKLLVNKHIMATTCRCSGLRGNCKDMHADASWPINMNKFGIDQCLQYFHIIKDMHACTYTSPQREKTALKKAKYK